MRSRLRLLATASLVLVLASVGGFYGWGWWASARDHESTDNAYVRGDVTAIGPKVAGRRGHDRPAVERDPDRVSGAWVFRGSRVPVKALFENLESGARIDDFLAWFPGVTREMAEAVLEHAQRSLQTEAP